MVCRDGPLHRCVSDENVDELYESGFIVAFPILGLYLRRNTVLKELWLAHNDLNSCDASNISTVLKANLHLQFLDISNNNIEVSALATTMENPFFSDSHQINYSRTPECCTSPKH